MDPSGHASAAEFQQKCSDALMRVLMYVEELSSVEFRCLDHFFAVSAVNFPSATFAV
jgi:hypothetical protein